MAAISSTIECITMIKRLIPILLIFVIGCFEIPVVPEEERVSPARVHLALAWMDGLEYRDLWDIGYYKPMAKTVRGQDYRMVSLEDVIAELDKCVGMEIPYDERDQNCFRFSTKMQVYLVDQFGNIPAGTFEYRYRGNKEGESSILFVELFPVGADLWLINTRHRDLKTIIGFKVEEFSRETAIEKGMLFQNLRI